MRKLILLALALSWSFPALAADMPTKAVVAPAPAWPAWTGFYGGLQAGYGADRQGTDVTGVPFGNGPGGVTGGLRAGYDWQVGKVVFGVVTDANLAGFTASSGMPGLSINSASTWWGATNARVGLSIFGDHWLPYAVGGLAYGGAKTDLTGANLSVLASKTLTGWDAGGGLEVRITPNLSAFGEYRWVELGNLSTPFTTQPFAYGVAMGGINFRFSP